MFCLRLCRDAYHVNAFYLQREFNAGGATYLFNFIYNNEIIYIINNNVRTYKYQLVAMCAP